MEFPLSSKLDVSLPTVSQQLDACEAISHCLQEAMVRPMSQALGVASQGPAGLGGSQPAHTREGGTVMVSSQR